MTTVRGWIPWDERDPRIHAEPPRPFSWSSTDEDADLGGSLAAGRSRGSVGSPVLDVKPWLGRVGSPAFNEAATAVDTTGMCDPFDMQLSFIVSARSSTTRLDAVTGIGGLRVWYIERGNALDPTAVTTTKRRTEITPQFIAEAGYSWRFDVQPTGLRFWQVILIFEAATASLPALMVAQAAH